MWKTFGTESVSRNVIAGSLWKLFMQCYLSNVVHLKLGNEL